jgi:hypothetical protein
MKSEIKICMCFILSMVVSFSKVKERETGGGRGKKGRK